MQDREIYCDECQEDFRIKLKTKTHKFTIKETYFVCPHCKKKYVAFITDPECRKLQKEINQLRLNKNTSANKLIKNKISESEYKKEIDIIEDDIKQLMNQLDPKMKALKWTYAN